MLTLCQSAKLKQRYLSAINGDVKITKLLIDNGATIFNNTRDKENKNPNVPLPMYLASLNGHQEVVEFLMKIPLSLPSSDICFPAIDACFVEGHEEFLEKVLELGKNLEGNLVTSSSLKLAASKGYVKMAKILLENCNPDDIKKLNIKDFFTSLVKNMKPEQDSNAKHLASCIQIIKKCDKNLLDKIPKEFEKGITILQHLSKDPLEDIQMDSLMDMLQRVEVDQAFLESSSVRYKLFQKLSSPVPDGWFDVFWKNPSITKSWIEVGKDDKILNRLFENMLTCMPEPTEQNTVS